MSTIAQIEANRRNALKSTGPRTPEGKAASCRNALRHGLRSRAVVLPDENREEYDQLCNDLEAEWQPQSRTEQFYVEQMAVSQWKLTRMEASELSLLRQADYGKVTVQDQIPLLDRIQQCQHRLERSYNRAQRELERLQDSRRHPVHPPEGEAATLPQPTADVPADREPAPAPKAPYIMSAAPAAGGDVALPSAEPNLRAEFPEDLH